MLHHVVLMRTRAGAQPEAREQILKQLRSLPALIPEIEDLSCGLNFADRSGGFDLVLSVRLAGKKALQTYRDHPEHVRVLETWIRPNVEQVVAGDYEY